MIGHRVLLALVLFAVGCEVEVLIGSEATDAPPPRAEPTATTDTHAATATPPLPPPPPAAAPVPQGTYEVRGTVTRVAPSIAKDKLASILQRHENELRFCAASQRAPERVALVLALALSERGGVANATIEQSDYADAAFQSCIVSAARRWTFPAPANRQPAALAYTVQLERRAP